MPQHNYGQDVAFLRSHAEVIELGTSPSARVAVVPAFQGRVMTATLAGAEGAGYGWLNRPFIELEREDDPGFNNYGGADRFWLGPEAGQFALFFRGDQPFDLDHWKAPAGFTTRPFDVTDRDDTSVAMSAQFDVTNYAGTSFDCAVTRRITALAGDELAELLGAGAGAALASVAFQSVNTLTNAGPDAWTRDGGLINIWILGMMKGLADGKVIIPLVAGDEDALFPKAKMAYFGEIPPDYAGLCEDYVWYKVDGLRRSKIGIPPGRARDVFGSYDIANRQLTIVRYALPRDAAELPYTNSAWEIQDDPFAGDPINSYNDPGTDAGEATFFELESSSPAAELAPGESITHTHTTCCFTGNFDALNALSRAVLGIDLAAIVD